MTLSTLLGDMPCPRWKWFPLLLSLFWISLVQLWITWWMVHFLLMLHHIDIDSNASNLHGNRHGKLNDGASVHSSSFLVVYQPVVNLLYTSIFHLKLQPNTEKKCIYVFQLEACWKGQGFTYPEVAWETRCSPQLSHMHQLNLSHSGVVPPRG